MKSPEQSVENTERSAQITVSAAAGELPDPRHSALAWLAAVIIPVYYAFHYVPYGMDTTDFGFFYGYPWRIVVGETPYRDFMYINPALPLYWHSIWMSLAPESWQVLAGKLVFWLEMLAASWFGALFLARIFDFKKLGLPPALMAVVSFVWGVHSFPAMPWHTVDGVFFGSAGLYAAVCGFPFLAGILSMASLLTKQSFLFMPIATIVVVFFLRERNNGELAHPWFKAPRWLFFLCPRRNEAILCALGAGLAWAAVWAALNHLGAWEHFKALTTKSLQIDEAIEAGILIYLRQEWWLPLTCLLPWILWRWHFRPEGARFCARSNGGQAFFWPAADGRAPGFMQNPPDLLQPFILYFFVLAIRYVHEALTTQTWIGFGESWPMFLVVLGGICVLLPGIFIRPWNIFDKPWKSAVGLGAAVLLAWSVGISGGYKAPAFFAAPLIFCAALVQIKLGGAARHASLTLWTALVTGLIMFGAGYEYPYVFPQRPMPRADLIHNAGQVFKKADGVYVDAKMLGTMRDLRELRAKYGTNYRTLPGFPMAYYLTGDKPAFISEWLLDWQINARVEHVYNLLVENDLIVFFEKDQLDVVMPDAYERARYSVPQMVRKNWKIVDETEYFVVMRRP